MWKREGYCQGGVSSTPGAGSLASPCSRSHISGREGPALPPCSLKLASPPALLAPLAGSCSLMQAWITSPLVPLPRFPTRMCLPRTAPLYSPVLLPAGIRAAASPHSRGKSCGGGRAPRPPPDRGEGARARAGSRDQSRGEREGEAGPKGRRISGHLSPSPLHLGLSAGEGQGPPSLSGQSRSCGDPWQGGPMPARGHGIARGGGALRELQGEHTAPVPSRARSCDGSRGKGALRGERRAPQSP